MNPALTAQFCCAVRAGFLFGKFRKSFHINTSSSCSMKTKTNGKFVPKPILFHCPTCRRSVMGKVVSEDQGTEAQCPFCGHVFDIVFRSFSPLSTKYKFDFA